VSTESTPQGPEVEPTQPGRLRALMHVARGGAGFLLGMAWDLTTLRRIDDLGDNVGLLGGMIFLALALILSLRVESERVISRRWGAVVVLAAAGAVLYQLAAIGLGWFDLGELAWTRQACSDGCWLPSLGARYTIGRTEAGVTIAGCLALCLVGGAMGADSEFLVRHKTGLYNFRQFMWGNILSAYVIFYFRSADLGPALLYVGMLGLLLTLNEWLPKRYRRGVTELLTFQFCAFSFVLYFLPVLAAYLPLDHSEWTPIRAILLRPGTWTPFAMAAAGSLIACTLISLAAHLGRPLEVGELPQTRRAGFRTVAAQSRVWLVLLVGMAGLRWMEAIPPAPLALKRQHIDARRVGPRELRCFGRKLPQIQKDYGVVKRFKFPADRRTWLVLKAKIFSPRHMKVPVSVEWEYFEPPGSGGRWWDPDAYWHEAKGGRQVQVPGWDDNGIMLRSCKRVFSGGSGRSLKKLWRITFSTPGDQSGLELMKLLGTDVPMTGTSAEDVYDEIADEVAAGVPLGRSVREVLGFTPISDRAAQAILEKLPEDLNYETIAPDELKDLMDQGIPLTEGAPQQLMDLVTSDTYKIGRTYFWLDEGDYPGGR
jgi:hypothetical protein